MVMTVPGAERSPLRVGVLGVASIFREGFLPSILRSRDARLVAVASRRDSDFTEEGVRLYTGSDAYQRLIEDTNVDAVYIPLPNHLHKEWTLKAAAAGKHVLCEKPLGVDADDAVEMVEACRVTGVHLVEAFMYRYNPQHHRAKEIVTSGEIGEVELVRTGFTVPLEDLHGNVRFQRLPGAGAVHDVGAYGINLVGWMMGEEPVRAHAFAREFDGTGADVLHAITLEFPNGRYGTISGGLRQAYRSFYEIVGTEGRVEVERPYATPPFVDALDELVLTVTTAEGTRTESFPDASQYDLQLDQFCRLVRGEVNSAYSAHNSIKTMRVIDACLRSVETGKAEPVITSV